jgi:hypothetical protein
VGRQKLIERAASFAPSPQLPAHHSLGAALLVERRAFGVARFRKNARAEPEDLPGAALLVEVDRGEADRRRADVETENAHGALPES